MRPRVRQQHRIAVAQQQIGIAKHAGPVVRMPMQQDHRIAVAMHRPDAPCAQRRAVLRGDGYLRQLRMIARGYRPSQLFSPRPQRVPPRMQRPFSCQNADSDAGNKPDCNKNRAQA